MSKTPNSFILCGGMNLNDGTMRFLWKVTGPTTDGDYFSDHKINLLEEDVIVYINSGP